MNINSTYQHYTSPASTGTFTPQNRAEDGGGSGSRWDIVDRLEIDLADIEAEKKNKSGFVWGGMPSDGYVARRRSGIGYAGEDLAGVKEVLGGLAGRRKDIAARLQKIVDKSAGSLGLTDRIKVEIGSDGKAVVGGIKDARLARAVEKAVNGDKELCKEIKAYQEDEIAASLELKSITGKSLKEYEADIVYLQKGGVMSTLTGDASEGWVYDRDQCINLEDQDVYMVDDELATMIATHVAAGDIDISGDNNILLDAEKTVNKTVEGLMGKVHDYLKDVNEHVRKTYADDPEEMKRHLVSLDKVKIALNSDSAVTIEGTFSEAGESDDMITKVITDKIFNEELKVNPYTGEKHDYFVAAQYLENQYDLAFDGADPDRKVETVFENNRVQSRIASPKEEARLMEEISVEARAALEKAGVTNAASLDIEVTDDGKIAVATMPEGKLEREMLEKALHALNQTIADRTNVDYNALEKPTNDPVKKLKGFMAKMDVFLPGGVGALKKAVIPDE